MRVAIVKAAYDEDAKAWYVQHSDFEGLHVEGDSFEAFCNNVAGAAADLIEDKSNDEYPRLFRSLATAIIRSRGAPASHKSAAGRRRP